MDGQKRPANGAPSQAGREDPKWPSGPVRPVVERAVRAASLDTQAGNLWSVLAARINVVLSSTLALTRMGEPVADDAPADGDPDVLKGRFSGILERSITGPIEVSCSLPPELRALFVGPMVVSPECLHVSKKSLARLFPPQSDEGATASTVTSVAQGCVREFRSRMTEKCVEATISLYLWLQVLGYQPDISEQWWGRWMRKSWLDFVCGRYEDRMKFLTAYLQAQHGDEYEDLAARYPPRPGFVPESDTHFLGGSAYCWFASRVTRGVCIEGTDRRLELIQALSGLKKRQPEIPRYKLAKATEDWIGKVFGTDPVQPPPSVAPFVKVAYRSVVQEVVAVMQRSLDRQRLVALPMPSTKARFGVKRSSGGAFGALHDFLISKADNPREFLTLPWEKPAISRESRETSIVSANMGQAACVPVWSLSWSDSSTGAFKGGLQSYYPLASLSTFGMDVGELCVEPQALPEPFKVRMISAGPWVSSMKRQVLQKIVHKALQELPEFHLTKEFDDRRLPEIVTSAFGQTPLALDEGYVSGDYTASTDNLASWASEIIVDELSSALDLDDATRDHFTRSLTGHRFDGPEGRVYQRSAQLMGSETSFPVLCVANLAASIVALRLSYYETDPRLSQTSPRPWWTLSLADRKHLKWCPGRSGLVINGDDFAARMRKVEYAMWRRVMPWFGLFPSMGKNFFSRDFVQLNSRMLVPKLDPAMERLFGVMDSMGGQVRDRAESRLKKQLLALRGRYQMVLVPSHSLQVLAPPRTVSFAEACLSLPQWQETFLDVASSARRDQLCSLFLATWGDTLKRLPSDHMNWFVPRSLGGFGLESTRPLVMSSRHRHIAAFLRDNTDPIGWRDAKLRWSDVAASTTVYADQTRALKALESVGLVQWGKVNELPVSRVLDPSVLNDTLAWSGYSRPLDGDRRRGVQPYVVPHGTHGQLTLGPTLGAPLEPDTMSWFPRSLARLKKAARATKREMSETQVVVYRPPSWGWYVPLHLEMQVARTKVTSATAAVRLNSLSPVVSESVFQRMSYQQLPRGLPFTLWMTGDVPIDSATKFLCDFVE